VGVNDQSRHASPVLKVKKERRGINRLFDMLWITLLKAFPITTPTVNFIMSSLNANLLYSLHSFSPMRPTNCLSAEWKESNIIPPSYDLYMWVAIQGGIMLKKIVNVGHIDRIKAAIASAIGNFVINDPSTPDLMISATIPTVGALKYAVQGFSAAPKNVAEKRALNCHIAIGNCINAVQSKMKTPIQRWASTSMLNVIPSAGVDLNAYYDRRSLRFFYYSLGGKNTYFADSVDIVTHELGHAVLDSMRPDFWNVQSLEIWSFHEGFSDIVAMFNLLNYDAVLARVLKDTNINLRTSNVASRLAEEVGALIRAVTNDPTYLSNALRDPAVETFRYIDPSSLPTDAPNNQLAAESHSFGRVFSAAWYNALTRTFELLLSKGKNPTVALQSSRDICFSVLVRAIPVSPRVNKYYNAVAKCMVAVARDIGPEYSKIFSDVFAEWGIISPTAVRSLSSKCRSEITMGLKRGDNVIKTRDGGVIISMRRPSVARIYETPMVGTLSCAPDLQFEMPGDSYYEFDASGNLVDEIEPDHAELLKSSAICVGQALSDDMWEQSGGKLVRKFIR